MTARLESLISGPYFMTVARDSLDGQAFRPRLSFEIGIWKKSVFMQGVNSKNRTLNRDLLLKCFERSKFK